MSKRDRDHLVHTLCYIIGFTSGAVAFSTDWPLWGYIAVGGLGYAAMAVVEHFLYQD